jgi:hypothetical protein
MSSKMKNQLNKVQPQLQRDPKNLLWMLMMSFKMKNLLNQYKKIRKLLKSQNQQ